MKNAILPLATILIGLSGCLGGGGETTVAAGLAMPPSEQATEGDSANAATSALSRGRAEGSTARMASGFASEGDPENPVELGTAPSSHRGEVGGVGNSYYAVSTGPGEWEASLAELSREGALYVYPAPEFSGPSLCSTASFETSSESCTVTCSDSSCTFGLRVYGFEFSGTGFLLNIR